MDKIYVIIPLNWHKFAEKLLFLRNNIADFMTNKEFLIELQKSCHVEMPLCMQLISQLQKVLAKAAVDQLPVTLPDLGTFTSHKHPEYVQEDPQTGAMTLYPPRITNRMQTEMNEDAVSCAVLLAEYAKMQEEDASAFIKAFVLVIKETLQRGEEIEVANIGTFSNVITHNSELTHISYVPCEQMKEMVNAPFSCFEPLVISEGIAIAKESVNEKPVEEEQVEEYLVEAESEEEESFEEDPVVAEEPIPAEEPVILEDKPVKFVKPIKIENSSNDKVVYISLALILLASVLLFWLLIGGDSSSDKNAKKVEYTEVVPAETVDTIAQVEDTIAIVPSKPINVVVPVQDNKTVKEQVPEKKIVQKEFHRMIGADGNPVTVKLQPGERLTIVALNNFGDKAFWPYVFDVNSDKLKAPNLVQAGMTLYLPDPAYYDIDANDEASLRKAKNRGAQLLK